MGTNELHPHFVEMAWLIVQLIFPTFRLSSLIFFIALRMQLGLPHPLIMGIFRCVCTHPINFMGIDLFRCAHGNEHIKTHDGIHNIFAAITQNASFHMGREQLHALLPTTFNASH